MYLRCFGLMHVDLCDKYKSCSEGGFDMVVIKGANSKLGFYFAEGLRFPISCRPLGTFQKLGGHLENPGANGPWSPRISSPGDPYKKHGNDKIWAHVWVGNVLFAFSRCFNRVNLYPKYFQFFSLNLLH